MIDHSEIVSYIKARIGHRICGKDFSITSMQSLANTWLIGLCWLVQRVNFFERFGLNVPLNLSIDSDLSRLVSGADQFQCTAQGCIGSAIYI